MFSGRATMVGIAVALPLTLAIASVACSDDTDSSAPSAPSQGVIASAWEGYADAITESTALDESLCVRLEDGDTGVLVVFAGLYSTGTEINPAVVECPGSTELTWLHVAGGLCPDDASRQACVEGLTGSVRAAASSNDSPAVTSVHISEPFVITVPQLGDDVSVVAASIWAEGVGGSAVIHESFATDGFARWYALVAT